MIDIEWLEEPADSKKEMELLQEKISLMSVQQIEKENKMSLENEKLKLELGNLYITQYYVTIHYDR